MSPKEATTKGRAQSGTETSYWPKHGNTPDSQGKLYAVSRKSVAHHQVFNPVAQLVNEQDGEVVHCLSKLNPEGLKQKA